MTGEYVDVFDFQEQINKSIGKSNFWYILNQNLEHLENFFYQWFLKTIFDIKGFTYRHGPVC